MRVLKDLGVTALLGSDRAAREGETPATLLTRAAAAGLRARAGRRCRAAVQAVETCPSETRSVANVLQTATLERLLASPDATLIREWCTLANAREVRVPPVVVPVLLDWWARQPSRSPEIFDATGACGAWLAGLNPDWRKPVAVSAIPADVDEACSLESARGSSRRAAPLMMTPRERCGVDSTRFPRLSAHCQERNSPSLGTPNSANSGTRTSTGLWLVGRGVSCSTRRRATRSLPHPASRSPSRQAMTPGRRPPG